MVGGLQVLLSTEQLARSSADESCRSLRNMSSRKRAKRERIVWIEPREVDVSDQVHGLVSTLFDADERFVSMELTGDRLVCTENQILRYW